MSRAPRLSAVLLVALLAGCATGLKPPQDANQGATPAGPQRGAYYRDDGPGASVPAGLANLPDAAPKDEPLHRHANRPYQVFGRQYTPFAELRPYRERGVASWYGRRFNGQLTASGERYDMYSMSAAHPLLPIPSYARVTNLANGRSVVVRVNDRGPFIGERIIDLSYAAAFKLGFVDQGSAQVEVESVLPGGAATVIAQPAPPAEPAVVPVAVPVAAPVATPVAAVAEAPAAASAPAAAQTPSAAQTPAAAQAQVATQAAAAAQPGVYLQLGAFTSRDNAESFRLRVYRELAWLTDKIQIFNSGSLYKVHLGPYRSRAEAKPVALRIASELDFTPMILVH
jgi:rare lipoprotein A